MKWNEKRKKFITRKKKEKERNIKMKRNRGTNCQFN